MLKKYLFLKTFVCILFALLISLMLFALNCKMWFVFFPLTFMMNYLPEIGPILIAALIVPAVLLDGSMELGVRGRNTIIAIIGGIVAKFVTANIIEMRLYTQSGGEFMRMHPVILMAMMFVFYEVLGTTGLFLAVPIVALMKYCLVTADMPEMLLDPVLVAIEGDRMAPQRNFVDRMATKAARQTAYPPHQHSMEQGFSMQNLGTQDVDTKPLLDA
jgi:AI-2 transport protein TqsA